MSSRQNFISYFLFFLFITSNSIYAQTSWQPLNTNTLSWRFEDMFWLDANIGWVVDGGGQILKTEDGGATWDQQFYDSDYYFRSVEFLDENVGFAGTLSSAESNGSLWKTTDGGITWNNITNLLPKSVLGICGMAVADDQTIFITGVFYGFAYIMKSSDQGLTWTYQNMGALCLGLVDIHFLTPLHGFAVGQTAQGTGLRAVIIETNDGGNSWQIAKTGDFNNQRAWKLQFINEMVGFASIEEFEPSPQYFKTIDGGQTWVLKDINTPNSSGTMQGIGFLNEDLGWVGGWSSLFYQTIDGGVTWEYMPSVGGSFNRFFRIDEGLIYTSGSDVYRYADSTLVDIAEPVVHSGSTGHEIAFRGSNIVYGEAIIDLELVNHTFVELSVYDLSGKRIKTLVSEKKMKGKHSFALNSKGLISGQYFLALYTYHGYEPLKFFVGIR
ncbi:MAG: YCF48-related protein [Bacteroidota bacterium]